MINHATADNPLRIEDYRLRYGTIPGPTDPKSRRRVLQLIIRGYGWVIGATPILVLVGDEQVPILSSSRDCTELTCVLPNVPAEGATIILSQGDRLARGPRRFSRKELPASGRAGSSGRKPPGEDPGEGPAETKGKK
ncbi:MAG TPA: hypothetical protein PKB14_10795 [Rubrivivax sp.]|nr:hypothetical protein [Rubrivivax sp.]